MLFNSLLAYAAFPFVGKCSNLIELRSKPLPLEIAWIHSALYSLDRGFDDAKLRRFLTHSNFFRSFLPKYRRQKHRFATNGRRWLRICRESVFFYWKKVSVSPIAVVSCEQPPPSRSIGVSDPTGLTDLEIELIDGFLDENFPQGCIVDIDTCIDPYFSSSPAFGLPCEVYDLVLYSN